MNEGFNRFDTLGYHGAIDLNDSKKPSAEKAETTSPFIEANPVLTKISNGEFPTDLSPERIGRMFSSGAEKVAKFGNRTKELFSKTAEKGGALFAFLRTETTIVGIEKASTKETAGATTESSKTETAEAKGIVGKLANAFNPEKAAASREKIKSASEKSAMAGAENFSFLKFIVEGIKRKLREFLLGKLLENTKQADKIKADYAQKLFIITQKRLQILKLLGTQERVLATAEATVSSSETGTTNTETTAPVAEGVFEAAPASSVAEQEKPVAEEIPAEQPIEAANDNTKETFSFDEGIETAFRNGFAAYEAEKNTAPQERERPFPKLELVVNNKPGSENPTEVIEEQRRAA